MKKLILFLILGLGMISCADSSYTILEGKIKVKGSASHTFIVLEERDSHTEYKVQNQKAFDLKNKQNQNLKLKVELLKKAIGPGFPAEIKILEIIP